MPINDPKALTPPMREATIAWLDAGGGRFRIFSGVRTYAEQVDLWNKYLAGGNLAARPGTSKHERGEAVDISGDKPLATRLAPQFGLGLTVPGEDWHFEVTNSAVASTYPRGFTVSEINKLIAAIKTEGRLSRESIRADGRLSREFAHREWLRTRKLLLKLNKGDDKDIADVERELAALDREIEELGNALAAHDE